MQLTAASGSVTKNYDYDAFGVEKEPDENDANPIRYTGQYYDKETETYYLRARNYSPSLGRFTQQDSWAFIDGNPMSMNLYSYCINNPIVFVDPSGHYPITVPISQADAFDAQNAAKYNVAAVSVEKNDTKKNPARLDLVSLAYEQYPWMAYASVLPTAGYFIADRINQSIELVEANKAQINKIAKKYGVPPEILAAIIFKEMLTQSLPDEVALMHTAITGTTHSVGLGAVFPNTARSAWSLVDPNRNLPSSNKELEHLLYSNNNFNIETIAAVLIYYAIDKYKLINDPSQAKSLSVGDWKPVVGRYNGAGNTYSDKVYQYLPSIKKLLS